MVSDGIRINTIVFSVNGGDCETVVTVLSDLHYCNRYDRSCIVILLLYCIMKQYMCVSVIQWSITISMFYFYFSVFYYYLNIIYNIIITSSNFTSSICIMISYRVINSKNIMIHENPCITDH